MTLGEEVDLMHGVGAGLAPSGAVGATAPVARLGIPAINEQDGPSGVGDGATGVTELPAAEALAATFDPKAARCYGEVIGTEERAKGINLVYGPTVNIVRVPEWGRAFEALGEDPLLTGDMAAAEVEGIQSAGTMAQVKHYAVYNQETYRNTASDDAVVSEKALQQIYLRPWDQVVRAAPSSVMCSFAVINGTDACQDRSLIGGYLDRSLHFGGFVGSDYGATHSTVAAVAAGLDQEQPNADYLGQTLISAVRDKALPRTDVNEAVVRILTEMYRFRLFSDDTQGKMGAVASTPGHLRIANQVAAESLTLLKNARETLPLSRKGGPIAVIGPAAGDELVTAGGGSATVTGDGAVSPLDGLRSALSGSRVVRYAPGSPGSGAFRPIPSSYLSPAYPPAGNTTPFRARLTAPASGTYEFAFAEPQRYSAVGLQIDGRALANNPGTPPLFTYTATAELKAGHSYELELSGSATSLEWLRPDQITPDISGAAALARRSTAAVVVVGDGQESEGADRANLELPGDQDELISAVAAANAHTIVVIDAGGPVAMPWLGKVAAVLDAWYPGEGDGSALASVLLGSVDPSGHLPITFPRSLSQTPVSSPRQFPGSGGRVDYSEGLGIGYRGYESGRLRPLFWFGYGLSYTSFRYSQPRAEVTWAGGSPSVHVSVKVTNVGKRPGADVAQLYLGQPAVAADPARQLAGFERVLLAPGRSRVVSFDLRGLELAYFETAEGRWQIPAGTYKVWLGDAASLSRLRTRTSFRLSQSTSTTPLSG